MTEGCYHIETSPLIYRTNQWTGFYPKQINGLVSMQSKSMDWFLYDNGLRHERVKHLNHKALDIFMMAAYVPIILQ